jgi:hypothetical protein
MAVTPNAILGAGILELTEDSSQQIHEKVLEIMRGNGLTCPSYKILSSYGRQVINCSISHLSSTTIKRAAGQGKLYIMAVRIIDLDWFRPKCYLFIYLFISFKHNIKKIV